jgi:hypothetical protein
MDLRYSFAGVREVFRNEAFMRPPYVNFMSGMWDFDPGATDRQT